MTSRLSRSGNSKCHARRLFDLTPVLQVCSSSECLDSITLLSFKDNPLSIRRVARVKQIQLHQIRGVELERNLAGLTTLDRNTQQLVVALRPTCKDYA